MSDLGRQNSIDKEIRDLLPGYVLGNLDQDELLAVNDFLARYPELWDEVRSLEHASVQLAYSAPTAAPPSGTKERILARAQTDAQQANAQYSSSQQAIEQHTRTQYPSTQYSGSQQVGSPQTGTAIVPTSATTDSATQGSTAPGEARSYALQRRAHRYRGLR